MEAILLQYQPEIVVNKMLEAITFFILHVYFLRFVIFRWREVPYVLRSL